MLLILCYFVSLIRLCSYLHAVNAVVVLVSSWRFSLIRGDGFQELLSELIC